jgi:hypothetical protein
MIECSCGTDTEVGLFKKRKGMTMTGTRVLLVTLLLAAGRATGGIITVPDDYSSIQAAIDAGQDGDTIIVQPGTYEENIVFGGRDVVLRSIDPNDPEIVAATIIKPVPTPRSATGGTAVTFANGETPAAVLAGFTITGGGGTIPPDDPRTSVGGGILCAAASPTIILNVITGNSVPFPVNGGIIQGFGAGICCIDSNAVVTRNVLRGNAGYAGGGIFTQAGHPLITNNLIYDNTATAGGGVCMAYGGELANNTLVDNQAEQGGNVYVVSTVTTQPCRIVNNILADPRGSQVLHRDGVHPDDLIAFNDVWSPVRGADTAWARAAAAQGNIVADPMFVDAARRDYRLRMDSPCINAGDPQSSDAGPLDAYGNARTMYHRIDIGAAEYAGEVRPVAKIADCPSTDELPASVTLDGSSSYDPDGTVGLTYRWSQVAGAPVALEDADQAVARFSPDTYGGFIFELVVADGVLESAPARVELVIGRPYVPVARAGLPAYATTIPVTLDGSGSTDPDASDALGYSWKQVSGPALLISDANSARPTISGFVQATLPQWCRFELTVTDGQHTSLPAGVDVVVLPPVGGNIMVLENSSFDPNKPTVTYFGGGDCVRGSGDWYADPWLARANVFRWNYVPDNATSDCTYERCGDVLLAYVYQAAPDYRQAIQTMGWSTGGQPAFDVATYLNLVYRDARYAVNHVTMLDSGCRDYSESILEYLGSAVDGEQCWVDSYLGASQSFYANILNARVARNDHSFPPAWYLNSLGSASINVFNHGVIGGAYWSVVGPGKNLQLAWTPAVIAYEFNWTGTTSFGTMDFMDEAQYPGRLPEPVTLVGPVDTGVGGQAMLTCKPSENAVRYQLLFGADPYRVMDYNVVVETPGPPDTIITALPFEPTWWTVRVYDAIGSSIYADPMRLTAFNLSLPVANATQGKRYAFIQQAIDAAQPGDEIVLNQGTYDEDVDFAGKSLTLRSLDPNAPGAAAATILHGTKTVVTISGGNGGGALIGLTITGGTRGILCSIASPAILHCRITGNRGPGIELRDAASPSLSQCLIADNEGDGVAMFRNASARIVKYNTPVLTNCTIARNGGAGLSSGMPTLANCIVYFNSLSISGGATAVTYTDIQSGWAGQGNLDADPLFASDYHLKSAAGRWDPLLEGWVQDAVTSPCIDAADPTASVLDEPAPNGARINMGAYGGTTEASKSL